MEYPVDGRCKNCGAALPQMMHGTCTCDFCGTEYTASASNRTEVNSRRDEGKAIALCQKSDVAYSKKSIGESISYLEEALGYDVENYMIWNKLGRSYRVAGNLEKARECYQKALSLKPGAIDVIANIGVLEVACKNYLSACQYCKQAYEAGGTTPADNATYAANYALTIAKTGDKKEALKVLEIARKRGYKNYATLKRMIKQG
jgi:Flp pilus assembly protein TadD